MCSGASRLKPTNALPSISSDCYHDKGWLPPFGLKLQDLRHSASFGFRAYLQKRPEKDAWVLFMRSPQHTPRSHSWQGSTTNTASWM